MSKDADVVLFLERCGPPSQILWGTCGNTSHARLRDILRKSFLEARASLEQGEPLVEITDAR
jgi:predicted nuclease of predicted toxin-antitoxin system